MTDLFMEPDEAVTADVLSAPKTDLYMPPDEGVSPGQLDKPKNYGGTFGPHFESAARKSIGGAAEQGAITKVLKGDTRPTDRQRMRESVRKIGGPDAPQYPDIDQEGAKKQAAWRKVVEDAVYDAMPIGSGGGAGVAGSVVGTLAAPENFVGIQGLIARRLPMLAGGNIGASAGRLAVEGAALNPVIDAAQQFAQMQSGAQPAFDLPRFAAAPVIGAAAGGVLGAGGAAIGKGIAALGRQAPADPAANQAAVRALDPSRTPDSVAPERARPQTIQDVLAAPQAPQPATVADVPPVRETPAPVASEPVQRGPVLTEGAAPTIQASGDRITVRPETLLGPEIPAIPAHRVSTATGSQVDVAPIVVEAASIRTSADVGYDAALQPRNRDRAASQTQIRDIATRLDAERLGYSTEADRGAPIVGPDGMVESGNGRVQAIRAAYAAGGDRASSYREFIAQQGVDVSGFKEPVLVRQRITDLTPEQRQKFTVEANQSATLSMSATERAKVDAGNLSTESLDLIRNPDNIGAAANLDFVKAFVRTLPQSEQGAIMDPRGGISSEGMTRVRNAILAKAYDDDGVLARIAESTNDEVKSISNALVAAAPDWAKLRGDIQAGIVRADMDATPDLMEAVRRVAEIRAKGEKLKTALSRQDAFNPVTTPVEDWMRSFYNGNRAASAKTIAEQLRIFATEARKVSDDALDLGLPPVRQEDIQRLAITKARGDGETSGNLFDGDGSGNGPDVGQVRAESQGPGIEKEGEGTRSPRAEGDSQGARQPDQAELTDAGNRVSPKNTDLSTSPYYMARYSNIRRVDGDSPGWAVKLDESISQIAERLNVDRPLLWLGAMKEGSVGGKRQYAAHTGGNIIIHDTASEKTAITLVMHEFGHWLEYSLFNNAPKETKNAIYAAWRAAKRIRDDEPKILEDVVPLSELIIGERPRGDLSRANRVYFDEFSEWWAEQVSRWITTNEKPVSIVEKFFAGIAKAWQEIYARVSGRKTYRDLSPEVDAFMKASWKERQLLDAENTGSPARSPADMEGRGAEAPASQPGDITGDLYRRRASGDVLPDQIKQGRPDTQGITPPAESRVTSVQNISRELVENLGTIARLGRVPGRARGVYKIRSGVIRVKTYGDLDTLVHELGHEFHIGGPVKADIDALVSRNASELTTYGAGKGAEGDAEAFANLFASYVLARPFAERTMPNATAELDALIKSRFPKESAIIEKTRADLETLHLAPSGEVVKAETISAPPPKFTDKLREFFGKDRDPFGRTIYSFFDALYTGFVDTAHPVYKAQHALIEIAKRNLKAQGKDVTGLDINPIDSPYIQMRLLPGAHGAADTMLKHGVIDANGIRPEGPSLASGIEKALGKKQTAEGLNNFGAYLIARRMVQEYQRFLNGELDRPPGNLSLADYQRAVQELEAANPSFREGAEDIYEFQNRYLKRMMDKGMISRDLYDTLVGRVDYVPLMRDMRDVLEKEISQSKVGTNQGLLLASTVRKFSGSDRMPINPLESIMKRVHDIEHAIKLNDAVSSLARLADNAGPGSGAIAEAIPNSELRGQKVDVIEALRSAGRQAGVHSDDINTLIQQAEDMLGDSTWTTLFRQESIQPGKEPIVFYWENGERRAIRLADRRLGREMYHAMTALSDYEKNIFIQTLSLSQALLRSGVTRSLDFIAVNLVRDQITASLTAGRKYVPFYSAAKGLVDALRKGDDSLEFAGGGGMGGGAIVEAIEASQWGRNVKGLQNPSIIKNLMKSFELSETGTRVGLYKSYFKQAKELGMDDQNAAVWAIFKSNDYIDFRRHGSYMGVMRRIIPFLNAAIQGTDREFRAAFDIVPLEAKRRSGDTLTAMELDRLKDARVALVRLTLLGIAGGSGVALLNSENDKYKNASKYNRDMNYLIPFMGVHISIPKGFGIVQSVANLFERGTELAMRNDPTLVMDWLSAAGSAFAPPTNNPLVATFYDTTANRNRFQEREIVPFYLKGVEPKYQYGPYTSEFAKSLGKLTNSSPLKIEYALNNTFGSLSRDFLFGWDAMMASDRPEKQIYDYPVMRRFIKNLDRGSQAKRAFYDLVSEQGGRLEQKENAYRNLINNGQRTEAGDFLRSLKSDERVWTLLNTSGVRTDVKRYHPMYRARDYISVTNGLTKQLAFNNVIKEADTKRTNLVVTRRDATPIQLDPHQRVVLMEELQGLSVAIARNSMVAMNAKGTTGLGIMDTQQYIDRIKLISPDMAKEFDSRLGRKNLPSDKDVARLWPEIQKRFLVDGEKAWFDDIVPKRRRSRR